METFFALLALCVGNAQFTGGLPSHRPVTRNFDVLFDLSQGKRLSKQSRRRWFSSSHDVMTFAGLLSLWDGRPPVTGAWLYYRYYKRSSKFHGISVVLSNRLINVFLNRSPPGQNGRHYADGIFGCIFVNEKFCISIKISLKFVPQGPIGNNLALV